MYLKYKYKVNKCTWSTDKSTLINLEPSSSISHKMQDKNNDNQYKFY